MLPIYILLTVWCVIALYAYSLTTKRGDDYHLFTIITEKGLENLQSYKYASTGYSMMDNFLNPWWTWVVSYVPASVMPNTLTFIALLCQCASCLLAIQYCPNMEVDIPQRWVYFVIFVLQFTYETLDAIDGKHARATGHGSPLGQLFDHGCDSVGTVFVSLCAVVTMRLGSGYWAVSFLFVAQFAFFVAQWAEHHTHQIRTFVGGFVGVTEAQWIGFAIFVSTSVFGTEHWLWTIGSLMPTWVLAPIGGATGIVGSLQLNHCVVATNCALASFVVWINAVEVFEKTRSFRPFMEFLPLLMLFVTALSMNDTATFHSHPALCMVVIGFAFSHITVQMIICNVSGMAFVIAQPVVGALLVTWVHVKLVQWYNVAMLLEETQVFMLYALVVAVLGSRYVYLSISHICNALDIYCFSLKHGGKKRAKAT